MQESQYRMSAPHSINIYFTILLMSIAVGCSANSSSKMKSFQDENVTVRNQNSNTPDRNFSGNTEESKITIVKNGDSKKIDCNALNEYKFVEVENPNRKQFGVLVPEDLNIVVGDEVLAKVELPKTEAKNFRLNSAEKTKAGFKMKMEWGGGLNSYKIQYDFRCKENNFYLYKVRMEIFTTSDPDSLNYGDKKEIKEIKIEPNLPIENFSILDYLGN